MKNLSRRQKIEQWFENNTEWLYNGMAFGQHMLIRKKDNSAITFSTLASAKNWALTNYPKN